VRCRGARVGVRVGFNERGHLRFRRQHLRLYRQHLRRQRQPFASIGSTYEYKGTTYANTGNTSALRGKTNAANERNVRNGSPDVSQFPYHLSGTNDVLSADPGDPINAGRTQLGAVLAERGTTWPRKRRSLWKWAHSAVNRADEGLAANQTQEEEERANDDTSNSRGVAWGKECSARRGHEITSHCIASPSVGGASSSRK
jgi:hypothetical protein